MLLYLVTDEAACLGRDIGWVVEEAVRGGVSLVQLREKTLNTRAFLYRAEKLKEILAPYQVPLLINDRIDVALASKADGVHIGQSDLPYAQVRDMLPSGKIIGLSAEKKEDVVEAEGMDISYLAVSPLFATSTKTDTLLPWGLEGLRWVRAHSRHPLVAIGGIKEAHVREVRGSGADSIAVVSAVCSAASPRLAAQRLLKLIEHNATHP